MTNSAVNDERFQVGFERKLSQGLTNQAKQTPLLRTFR